jgi:long-chain acyl-CoA synthetase
VLSELLAATAARHGERTALRWRDRRVSWNALVDGVEARAGELERLGVAPGDVVALLLENCPDLVASFFAAASLGAVAVPLNPAFTAAEIGEALDGCPPRVVVAAPAAAARCEKLAERWRRQVAVRASDGDLSPCAARRSGGSRTPVSADADALYGFSSGTTGMARRFARTHANLAREAECFGATVGLGPDDVILGAVPFFHAHGLGNCVLASVRSGATLVVLERFDPRGALARVSAERVSVLPGVPFTFRMMAEVPGAARADAGSLRLCFSAGAPLPRATFDAFRARFGAQIRQLYGCSEAGAVSIHLDPDAEGGAETVGRPLHGVAVRIQDEAGRALPGGESGRIAISSPALARGYHGSESLTREAFRDGWFLSGDLGRIDGEGRMRIEDRVRPWVSTPAGKVDPGEVERCIAALAGVREVAVVGVPARDGERVKAVVVPRDPAAAPASLRREIVSRCRDQLAEFKLPRVVEFRSEIPRNALGKLRHKDLVSTPGNRA